MKAILEFNIPDDNQDYAIANAATDMLLALDSLRKAFRAHRKYDAPQVTEDDFYAILQDHNIDLDLLLA